MTIQPILQNLSKHIILTEEEEGHFISLLQPKTFKKKQFLLRENEISKNAAFVVKGCLRSYIIDQNGFEYILQFAPADWWVTDMYSFVTLEKGHLNIDAIEDSEVLLLSRADQLRLFDDIPKFERFFRVITENALVSSRQRLLETLSLSAKDRYVNFCKAYPGLIHSLPQKQIASYIGVTPEFLSKMKTSF